MNKEQITDLANAIYERTILHSPDLIIDIITEWLNQNPVGLSDEQVNELIDFWAEREGGLLENYKEWAKTQTFSQSQQFQPNWDDVPEWANWLAQDANGGWYLYENKPDSGLAQWGRVDKRGAGRFSTNPNWIGTLQQRPAPATPKVEVGQIWKVNGSACRVKVLLIQGSDLVVDGLDVGGLAAYKIEDFLAKFEQVYS
jgi:hypothetical protein